MDKRLPSWFTFILAPAAIGVAYAVLSVAKLTSLQAFGGVYFGTFTVLSGLATFFTDVPRLHAGLAFVGSALASAAIWFVVLNSQGAGALGTFSGALLAVLAGVGGVAGAVGGTIGGRKTRESLGTQAQRAS